MQIIEQTIGLIFFVSAYNKCNHTERKKNGPKLRINYVTVIDTVLR